MTAATLLSRPEKVHGVITVRDDLGYVRTGA